MSEEVEPMLMFRVQVPDSGARCLGHGDRPRHFTLRKNGKTYEFPAGLVVRSSHHCDPDYDVATLDNDPPLVRTDIIEQYPEIFKPIKG